MVRRGSRAVRIRALSDCDECSGGKKVGNLYGGGSLRFENVEAAQAGTYYVNVAYTSGDERSVEVSANGKPATTRLFPSSGDWGAAETISVPVTLRAGRNTITFDSGAPRRLGHPAEVLTPRPRGCRVTVRSEVSRQPLRYARQGRSRNADGPTPLR
ncbi:carbohydrate-binding protein [Streptomyces brevispora]|uniref:carbohydrate-binding protein n=1 Tax=Streptomyces brevispora TaxID=887462 RepID=UPI00119F0453|nr:carbohydrate-binding protein [Streptomyces brevispora]